jgi:hypothetical protein
MDNPRQWSSEANVEGLAVDPEQGVVNAGSGGNYGELTVIHTLA